ncbi:MAG: glycosyltransferase family 4 protein, partial [Actinomycetota bacterium]
MRLALLTGIFPPDIGGPATHSADLADAFRTRGHFVTIVTLGDQPKQEEEKGVVRFPRGWPWLLRNLAVARWLFAHRVSYDVIYATGLHEAAALGGLLARRPVAIKVVGDPVWERARRWGLTSRDFEDFQKQRSRPWALRPLAAVRDWTLRRARVIVVPSESLVAVVAGWGLDGGSVKVILNGVRITAASPESVPNRDPQRVVFVGRLVTHKKVGVLIEAVCRVGGICLEIVGEGPDASRLAEMAKTMGVEGRVRFPGSMGHDEVMQSLAGAAALVTASDYEGLPHVAIEALAVGTPIICPSAGGFSEVVRDGVNGLIV